ncbi:winged helix DNA-binding domain-containing protein [Nesterenkonia pannonica]|uniref:DNA glycosylase AlkZ-like family protein n=1 Tax=Nesterenkonia pannonica TaxID=1548602 RepID=UPI002164D3AD|nr:crosslink repair DNA glycosylase YcaQ family protein [Nesterenkonia pannonica]
MTVADFAHHYHVSRADAGQGVEAAGLLPVAVEGWKDLAYVTPETVERGAPEPGLGPVSHARLIGPFDPLLRDRGRAQRIFGFDYRFEAYVPRDQRIYGHYVMGLLSGNELIGRADVRRRAGELVVGQTWHEPGVRRRSAEARSAAAAATLARQLGVQMVHQPSEGGIDE